MFEPSLPTVISSWLPPDSSPSMVSSLFSPAPPTLSCGVTSGVFVLSSASPVEKLGISNVPPVFSDPFPDKEVLGISMVIPPPCAVSPTIGVDVFGIPMVPPLLCKPLSVSGREGVEIPTSPPPIWEPSIMGVDVSGRFMSRFPMSGSVSPGRTMVFSGGREGLSLTEGESSSPSRAGGSFPFSVSLFSSLLVLFWVLISLLKRLRYPSIVSKGVWTPTLK